MPLVIFEGPEAAGKTTLLDALIGRWGGNHTFVGWGPRDSWLEYCQPLFESIYECREDPTKLIVWSRSWLSRAVYNSLLNQGQVIPACVIKELDSIVIREKGLLLLVVSPVTVMLNRRLERLSTEGSKPDHPLDPEVELREFYAQNRSRKWTMIPGNKNTSDTVEEIIQMLVHKNPECLMDARLEEPISV